MNKTAKFIVITFAIIIVVLLWILAFVNPPKKGNSVAGAVPIAPSYPTSPDGHVQIFGPTPNQVIISPVAISGNATGGGWFFEGTFPIKILDGDGTVLGRGQAQAETDWTSTGTVPFSANVSFSAPRLATGTVVFSKDNPSGLPQNSGLFSVPVRFQQ